MGSKQASLTKNPRKLDHRSDQTKEKTSVIYFALMSDESEAESGFRVKIGYTDNFKQREANHKAQAERYRHKHETLCVIRGKKADESALHRVFREYRWGDETEIFHAVPQIVDYIRWLRDQYYVFVPDDEQCQDIEELEYVDWTFWNPTAERRKPAKKSLFSSGYGPLNLPPRELTGDDFYTNPVVITAARAVLGDIDLDPASHAIANRVVRAKTFYTISDDGLSKPWSGNVWLNPPFSKWGEWVPKVLSEWSSGNVKQMCVLSAMRTITAQYFSPLLGSVDAWCVIRGRIRFWGGHAGDSPDDGHAVFYFGSDRQRFLKEFSELGEVFYKP